MVHGPLRHRPRRPHPLHRAEPRVRRPRTAAASRPAGSSRSRPTTCCIANLDPTLERRGPATDVAEVLDFFPDGLFTAEVAAVMTPNNQAFDRDAAEDALIGLAADGGAARVRAGQRRDVGRHPRAAAHRRLSGRATGLAGGDGRRPLHRRRDPHAIRSRRAARRAAGAAARPRRAPRLARPAARRPHCSVTVLAAGDRASPSPAAPSPSTTRGRSSASASRRTS